MIVAIRLLKIGSRSKTEGRSISKIRCHLKQSALCRLYHDYPGQIEIGDVKMSRKFAKELSRVPRGYNSKTFGFSVSQETLGHLRWMMQKDLLQQDMFLLGPPGNIRRRLALRYAELTNRETYVLPLTRDTTESDLKQRREIIHGSAIFVDQAPVKAAMNGSLLILDGIEKAERNVLPTINNLLENREMQLEDGRFIMGPKQYKKLLDSGETPESLARKQIVPAHDDFRVIALGVPVPPYNGKPLDPPLRSRFQVRVIHEMRGAEIWTELLGSLPTEIPSNFQAMLKDIAGIIESIKVLQQVKDSGLASQESFPENAYEVMARILYHFPQENPATLMGRSFPFISPLSGHQQILTHEQQELRDRYLKLLESNECFANHKERTKPSNYVLQNIDQRQGIFVFGLEGNENDIVEVKGSCGENKISACEDTSEIEHGFQKSPILAAILQDHIFGRDILICGGPGTGKSVLSKHLAKVLGYKSHLFSLYQDMTARDLLQRRTTNKDGSTGWDFSPLVHAAINGDLCILDGLEKLHPDTLTIIQRLITDREAELFDGTILSAYEKPNMESVHRISPKFRVVALVTLQQDKKLSQSWLTPEILSMFSIHHLEALSPAENELLLRKNFPAIPNQVFDQIRLLLQVLGEKSDEKTRTAETLGVKPLSTRQLIRLGNSMNKYPESASEELRSRIHNMLMTQFISSKAREDLNRILDECGIQTQEEKQKNFFHISSTEEELSINNMSMRIQRPTSPELVPSPLFFDIEQHKSIMYSILKDLASGEKHLLLIGNQGVGKNKIADRMLQLLNSEREYLQLHRDSTVGNLTLLPSIREGQIIWEDSPLVRAVLHGRTLVVDEADKAPLEVVSVLKALVEDEEMLLADGRRILSAERAESVDNAVPIHPGFRMWVLANRPGYPFLGNDFFKAIGDIFSPHVIPNPDEMSELQLLQAYGPSVPIDILQKLVGAFRDLRKLVENDILPYPYSTREAVAVVRHLERFPDDGVVETLENVLGFDAFDLSLRETIEKVFQSHDIPLQSRNSSISYKLDLAEEYPKPMEVTTEIWKYKKLD